MYNLRKGQLLFLLFLVACISSLTKANEIEEEDSENYIRQKLSDIITRNLVNETIKTKFSNSSIYKTTTITSATPNTNGNYNSTFDCPNSENSEHISLEKYNYTIEFQPSSNLGTEQDFGVWKFDLNKNWMTTISLMNYNPTLYTVDIVITSDEYMSSYESVEITETTKKIKFKANFVIIRTYIEEPDPKLIIKLFQETNSDDRTLTTQFEVAFKLFFIVLIIILGVFGYVIVRSAESDYNHMITSEMTIIEEIISNCLDNMNTGSYSRLTILYSQVSGSVCGEDFLSEDLVKITNECKHCFHKKCIQNWFESCKHRGVIKCPYCFTILENLPNSISI